MNLKDDSIVLDGRKVKVGLSVVAGLLVVITGGVVSLVWRNADAIQDIRVQQGAAIQDVRIEQAVQGERLERIREDLSEIKQALRSR